MNIIFNNYPFIDFVLIAVLNAYTLGYKLHTGWVGEPGESKKESSAYLNILSLQGLFFSSLKDLE